MTNQSQDTTEKHRQRQLPQLNVSKLFVKLLRNIPSKQAAVTGIC